MGQDDETHSGTTGVYQEIEITQPAETAEPAESSRKTLKTVGSRSLPLDSLSQKPPESGVSSEELIFLEPTPEAVVEPAQPAEPQNGILLTRGDLILIFVGLPVICVMCVLLAGILIIHSISKQATQASASVPAAECKTSSSEEQLKVVVSQKIAKLEEQDALHAQKLEEVLQACQGASKQFRRYRRHQSGQPTPDTQDHSESPSSD